MPPGTRLGVFVLIEPIGRGVSAGSVAPPGLVAYRSGGGSWRLGGPDHGRPINMRVWRASRAVPTRASMAVVDVQQGRQYDVAADGRFLVNTALDETSSRVTLIQN